MQLDEHALREELKPLLWNPMVDRALALTTNDRGLLSIFLTAVSYLEGIGALAIASIRQTEVSRLMHDLDRHELEEHGHMDAIRLIVQELFPDLCEDGRHMFEDEMFTAAGQQFYHKIRDTSRRRLRQLGRFSPLSMYLLITFGGETLVEMLYSRVIESLQHSTLPRPMTERIEFVLRMILAQEDTHDVLLTEQHNMLVDADRTGLSDHAKAMLDTLRHVTPEDYRWVAEFMIREFVWWWWMSVSSKEGDLPAAAEPADGTGAAT